VVVAPGDADFFLEAAAAEKPRGDPGGRSDRERPAAELRRGRVIVDLSALSWIPTGGGAAGGCVCRRARSCAAPFAPVPAERGPCWARWTAAAKGAGRAV
jgi:hypothetical protein